VVGIVLVSHTEALARSVAELIREIGLTAVRAVPAGGTDDGRAGTSAEKIAAALSAADGGDGVVILADLGSAVLMSRLVVEDLVGGDTADPVRIADAPFVEGAVAAAGAAVTGADLTATVVAAEEARTLRKL
jgi:PTS hybrid protein